MSNQNVKLSNDMQFNDILVFFMFTILIVGIINIKELAFVIIKLPINYTDEITGR